MPAKHEDELTYSRLRRQGVEVGWTPEAEAALARAREAFDSGYEIEGHRILEETFGASPVEVEGTMLFVTVALVAVAAFLIGLLTMGIIWAL